MSEVADYSKKLAEVKLYETKLEASKIIKDKGLTNIQIKYLEENGITIDTFKRQQEKPFFKHGC